MNTRTWVAGACLLACHCAVAAKDSPVYAVASVSAIAGSYNGELILTQGGGTPMVAETDDSAFGGAVAGLLGKGKWIGSAALEFVTADNFDRTDLLLTGGYRITDTWNAFVGYRQAWQGDGFLNDDFYSENGPFVGGGFGGVQLGEMLLWGSSLAVNFSELDLGTGTKFDMDGLSLKTALAFANTPHSVELRLQLFEGDETFGADRAEFDERYLYASYTYRFLQTVFR